MGHIEATRELAASPETLWQTVSDMMSLNYGAREVMRADAETFAKLVRAAAP